MLRLIFVSAIILMGGVAALHGPFNALLFYLWNAYFRPEVWTYGNTVYSLNLSFVIGVFLVISTIVSRQKLPFNARTAMLMLFFVQTSISTLYSEHFEASWSYWLIFSRVLLISYLIVVLVNDRRRLRLTLLVIALSLGFECAKQGWATLLLSPGAMNNNPIPFLGDNNGVALGVMMLVPLFGALAKTATRPWERPLYWFLAVGVFYRGFTTYSRGGFLAAAVLGLITLIRSERKLRTIFAVTAIATVVWTVMPPSFWARMDTISISEEELDSSALGRLHFWGVAARMAEAKPLTGVGLNAFLDSYDSYNESDEFGGDRAVHSVWFGALADLGYPGLLLFVGNWCMGFLSCWSVSRKRDPSHRELRLYANALMTSLIVFGVAGSFLSMHYNEMFWHFVGLSAALQRVAQAEVAVTTAAKTAHLRVEPALAR